MPVFLNWLLRIGVTNPIAVRLVQNGSRRTRHLYIRAAYLAALIVVLLWALLLNTDQGEMSYRALAEAGAASFEWIAYLQIALICVLAPVFMAGAIAQESNPRTWDILLTTPLSSIQIVLGNLLGRLFFILALLLCSLPLFALTQYFGGVPGRSIFASYAVAGCAAILVGAIAIALSVSRLVGRRAVFAFYVSVVSYLALTYAIDYWLRFSGRGAGPGGNGVTWMTAVNPFLSLRALLEPSLYPRAEPGPGVAESGPEAWFLQTPVTAWCVGSLLLSFVLVAASTFTVRTGGLGGLGSPTGVPWYRRMLGLGGAGYEHRPPRAVWTNPIAWREAAARNATLGRMIARWAFIALGGLLGLGLIAMHYGGGMSTGDYRIALLATVWGELAVTALVSINMAATAISREREDGTLDLLTITPITAGQYLTGKMRGLIAYLLPMLAVPVGTLLAAGLYSLTDGLGRPGGASMAVLPNGWAGAPIPAPVPLPEAGLLAPIVLVPFVAFCVMIGLFWSLKQRGTLSSVVGTVAVAGAVSGIVGLCGWNAGAGVDFIGPAVSAFSPVSLVYSLVDPVNAASKTVIRQGGDLSGTRVALVFGAFVAAGLMLLVVYSLHAYMVRNFDRIVRSLAGIK